jgi:hypothetical protein
MDEKFSHIMLLLLLVWWQWRGNLTLAQCCLCITVFRAHRMVMMVTVQLERTDIIYIFILLYNILWSGGWLPKFWRNTVPPSAGKELHRDTI